MNQAVLVEQRDRAKGLFLRHAGLHHRLHEKAGNARACRPATEKQEALVCKRAARHAQCCENPSKHDGCGALDVVVKAGHTVAITRKNRRRVWEREVFELNARTRKHFLYGRDERLDKFVILSTCDATLAQAQIKRIGKQALVVRAHVQRDRQRKMRRNAGARCIKREFADRDTHAVHAEIAESQNSFAVSDNDETDIGLRPVAQDFLELLLAIDREIQTAWTSQDMAEVFAGFADCWRIHQRNESRRIRHEHPVKQGLVCLEQ